MSKEEIREQLKTISREVKPLVDNGQFTTINAAIIATYKNEPHQEFKLFPEWKKANHKIIKGSKGFPIWTRPKDNQKVTDTGEVDEYSFFGVCFLFSNAQVEPIN